jgi:DNA-directed RNA polymerase subunit RPC12/RpoP
VCGSHGHIDGYFLYHYACAKCGRKYALGMHVPLIELTPEQATRIENGGGCGFKTDPEVLEDEDE